MKKRQLKKNLKKNKDKNRKRGNHVTKIAVDKNLIPDETEWQKHRPPAQKSHSIPEAAKVLEERDGWVLYVSYNEHAIYIESTDYHADPLRLTKEHLEKLASSTQFSYNTLKR